MPLAWCPGTCLWLRWRMTSRSDGGRTSLARNCHVTFCLQSPFPGDKEEPPCNSTSCFVVIVFKFINLPLLVVKGCSLKYFSWLPAKVCWKLKLELEENLEAREAGDLLGPVTLISRSCIGCEGISQFSSSASRQDPQCWQTGWKNEVPVHSTAIKCQGDFLTFLHGNNSQIEIKVTED